MKKVEQIAPDGSVVIDYDQPYTTNAEIKAFLGRYVTVVGNNNPFEVIHHNTPLIFCVKSVTYLGHPHPIYKKRIQIPNAWRSTLQQKNSFLVGLYRYRNTTLCVFFDTIKYKNNKLNNSSAHVYSIDLAKGSELGIFSKEDIRGNKITVVRDDMFSAYLTSVISGVDIPLSSEMQCIESFALNLKKQWRGKVCYAEMLDAQYRNAKQAEWPGFYLEYVFEKFCRATPETQGVCTFVSDKTVRGLDFDLNFHDAFLGDLKMHTDTGHSVPGNDTRNVMSALKKHGKLWYVVFVHSTEYDKAHAYQVTKYWNTRLSKNGTQKNLLSYGQRMKYSVALKEVLILELNKFNTKYLIPFRQGKNANGKIRNVKVLIPISKRNIDNFLTYRKVLS
jgi:hypothetical protein